MDFECDLSKKKCVPCRIGVMPLKGEKLAPFIAELGQSWNVINEHHLEREFIFSDFQDALNFTNKVGKIAEEEGHHPDIYLTYGKVKVSIWTHKINGLYESDFILAAKYNHLK